MTRTLSRRDALQLLAAAGAIAASPAAAAEAMLQRPIPSTGEPIPAIGLGTWITFNVGNDPVARANAAEVMRAFLAGGGRMIDSSPMYGSSQEVVGDGLAQLGRPATTFSADKVWIGAGGRGRAQIETSRRRWGVPRFDLVQVHNLLAWEEHLPLLLGKLRQGAVEVAQLERGALRRLDREHRGDILDRDADALAHRAAHVVDMLVVEDGEEPGAEVRAGLPEMRLRERPHEAALHEVVGARRVARQRAGIAAKKWQMR